MPFKWHVCGHVEDDLFRACHEAAAREDITLSSLKLEKGKFFLKFRGGEVLTLTAHGKGTRESPVGNVRLSNRMLEELRK